MLKKFEYFFCLEGKYTQTKMPHKRVTTHFHDPTKTFDLARRKAKQSTKERMRMKLEKKNLNKISAKKANTNKPRCLNVGKGKQSSAV